VVSPKFAEEFAGCGRPVVSTCEIKAGPMGPAQATGLPYNF
jgi:hypothetical protein